MKNISRELHNFYFSHVHQFSTLLGLFFSWVAHQAMHPHRGMVWNIPGEQERSWADSEQGMKKKTTAELSKCI